jgi:hypothetical protein
MFSFRSIISYVSVLDIKDDSPPGASRKEKRKRLKELLEIQQEASTPATANSSIGYTLAVLLCN